MKKIVSALLTFACAITLQADAAQPQQAGKAKRRGMTPERAQEMCKQATTGAFKDVVAQYLVKQNLTLNEFNTAKEAVLAAKKAQKPADQAAKVSLNKDMRNVMTCLRNKLSDVDKATLQQQAKQRRANKGQKRAVKNAQKPVAKAA